MVSEIIRTIEEEQFKASIPYFGPGDTVRVHAKVVEGNRERIQVFEGVVIRRRGGGINENFTVRRTASHGIGVERTFLIHSPRIDKIEVVRHGKVRRAKLYYLRDRTGKAARIQERRRPARMTAPTLSPAAAAAAAVVDEPAVETVEPAADIQESQVEEPVEAVAEEPAVEAIDAVSAEEAPAAEEQVAAAEASEPDEEAKS